MWMTTYIPLVAVTINSLTIYSWKAWPGNSRIQCMQAKRNSRVTLLQQVGKAIHTDQKSTEGTKRTLRKSQTDELSITFDMQKNYPEKRFIKLLEGLRDLELQRNFSKKKKQSLNSRKNKTLYKEKSNHTAITWLKSAQYLYSNYNRNNKYNFNQTLW